MSTFTITLPGLPISLNRAYRSCRSGRVYLTPEGKEYKAGVTDKFRFDHGFAENDLISISYTFYGSWFTNAGTPRKKDADNLVKLLQDAVFEGLDLDDSRVFESSVKKIDSDVEETVVVIKRIA